MEQDNRSVCKYYKANSCKNGAKCVFKHVGRNNQDMSKRYMDKQSVQIPQENETKKYLNQLIESMHRECFACKKQSLLVHTSCGCYSLCENCTIAQQKCPQKHDYSKIYIK